MTSNPQWDAWIQQGLGAIREKKLERVLRPLIPTSSPVEVSKGVSGFARLFLPQHHADCTSSSR